ncbi:hypothetical protein D3C73_1030040 [compost metagenome]
MFEKMFKQIGVELEVGWKLPKERTKFFLELQYPGGEKVGQGQVDVTQALDVRDETWGLDAEDEASRSFVIPQGITLRALQGVKRSIDLDTVDGPRGELQFALLSEPLGVEIPPPGRITPA